MGSPLGPTLANLFLVNYESKWLKDCPVQFAPKCYRRFVDDVFFTVQGKGSCSKVFSLNELSSSQHKVYPRRRK